MSAASPSLDPIEKTPLQRKLERRDPRGRDIRLLVWDAYNRHRDLQKVAAEFTALLEDPDDAVSAPAISRWIDNWGWEFSRVLVIPEAAEAAR
jgi:hypothetical protein